MLICRPAFLDGEYYGFCIPYFVRVRPGYEHLPNDPFHLEWSLLYDYEDYDLSALGDDA